MSKKKKKINNTAEEIKNVVTETEVSLDELDKFEPDLKEQHHTSEAAPKKVEEADNSESITEEEEVHDLIEGDLIEDFDYLEDDVPEESAEEAVEEVVENTDSQPKKEKKPKEKKEKKAPRKKEKSEPKAEKAPAEGSTAYTVRMVVILAAICTGIALLLSVVNMLTENVIAENVVKEQNKAVLSIFPDGEEVKEYTLDSGETVFAIIKDGGIIGCCVNSVGSGYGGDINLMVGIDTDGKVSGISFVSMSETPGVGTKVKGEGFVSQFIGLGENAVIGENVDGISGATFSSKGVAEAVNNALALGIDFEEMAKNLGEAVTIGGENTDDFHNSNEDNGEESIKAEEVEEAETTPAETETETETEPETEPEVPVIAEPETEPETETETETQAPETETETWIPETQPETQAPETETQAPETEAPETEAETQPETQAPETETETETEAPETETDPGEIEIEIETDPETETETETETEEETETETETKWVKP
ncbi:MAG: FMN-binding protein [Clostridia bacterium]|nr:FMN-binding protein [Clostridia bacterium]